MKPFVGGPLIILVDNNPGRVEYLEYFFFQNGYLIRVATLDDLAEKGTLNDVKLELSYLSFEPEVVTDQDIPVIFAVSSDDSPSEQKTTLIRSWSSTFLLLRVRTSCLRRSPV